MNKIKTVAAFGAAYYGWSTLMPSKIKSIEGRTVLVTGAASGLGRVLALELAQRATGVVLLLDINEIELEETKQRVLKLFPKAIVKTFVCNLASRVDIARCTEEIKQQHHVEILINNAGVVTGKPLLSTSDEKNELTMQINALAHIYLSKAFLPDMITNKFGHICGVGSVAGLLGAAGMVDYSASKFAARGFYEALSLELFEQGIRSVNVSCVCPTLIDTGLFDGFYVPLNPTLKTIDVARGVIWAIEHNWELLVMPSWLQLTTLFLKSIFNVNGSIGIKTPFASPMKDWNDSKSQQTFHMIQNSKL